MKFGVSVPKKKIKRAVDRNRIKRKIREFYRLNKNDLYTSVTERSKSVHLMFIYSHDELESIDKAEKSIPKLLNKLKDVVEAD